MTLNLIHRGYNLVKQSILDGAVFFLPPKIKDEPTAQEIAYEAVENALASLDEPTTNTELEIALAVREMLPLYEGTRWDILGYPIRPTKNPLEYHYIEEEIGIVNTNKDTLIKTGALLTKEAKSDLNLLKELHPSLYEEINFYLQIINDIEAPLSKDIEHLFSFALERMDEALDSNINEDYNYRPRPEQKPTQIEKFAARYGHR